MIDLNQVLTFTEAAEKWGLAGGNTLRQAVLRGKFTDQEVRKSGTVWLTTYEAMTRIFGALPAESVITFTQNEIRQALQQPESYQKIDAQVKKAFAQSQKVQIVEHFLNREHILYLFTSLPEFENWISLIKRSLLPGNNS